MAIKSVSMWSDFMNRFKRNEFDRRVKNSKKNVVFLPNSVAPHPQTQAVSGTLLNTWWRHAGRILSLNWTAVSSSISAISAYIAGGLYVGCRMLRFKGIVTAFVQLKRSAPNFAMFAPPLCTKHKLQKYNYKIKIAAQCFPGKKAWIE